MSTPSMPRSAFTTPAPRQVLGGARPLEHLVHQLRLRVAGVDAVLRRALREVLRVGRRDRRGARRVGRVGRRAADHRQVLLERRARPASRAARGRTRGRWRRSGRRGRWPPPRRPARRSASARRRSGSRFTPARLSAATWADRSVSVALIFCSTSADALLGRRVLGALQRVLAVLALEVDVAELVALAQRPVVDEMVDGVDRLDVVGRGAHQDVAGWRSAATARPPARSARRPSGCSAAAPRRPASRAAAGSPARSARSRGRALTPFCGS